MGLDLACGFFWGVVLWTYWSYFELRELSGEQCLHVGRLAGHDHRLAVHDLKGGQASARCKKQIESRQRHNGKKTKKNRPPQKTHRLLMRVHISQQMLQQNIIEDVFARGVHASVSHITLVSKRSMTTEVVLFFIYPFRCTHTNR